MLHAILTGCRLMTLLRLLLMVLVPGSEGMGTRSWGWQGRVEPPSRHHGGSGPPPPPRVEQRYSQKPLSMAAFGQSTDKQEADLVVTSLERML